jgi:hypothetical protein
MPRVTHGMLATSFRSRTYLAVSALLGVIGLARLRDEHIDAPQPPDTSLSSDVARSSTSTMADDAPPAFDVVESLHTIANRWLEPSTPPTEGLIPAAGRCQRPTAKQRRALNTRLTRWVAARYPHERADLGFSVGCVETTGLAIAMSADVTEKRGPESRSSLWWVLRVTDATITVIAERRATAEVDYMEWADEGTLDVIALVDLDGDDIRDIVWERTEHAGGAVHTYADVRVERSTTGNSEPVQGISLLPDVELQGNTLVFGLTDENDPYDAPLRYRCLTDELGLHPCAKSTARARLAAASRLAAVTASTLPTRDAASSDLTLLRVTGQERAAILGALPRR